MAKAQSQVSNYLQRISQSEEERKSSASQLAEAHARASVEQKVSQLKAQKATLQAAYEAALGSNPFNIDKVFSLTQEVADNAANLELAESILATEF